MCDHTHLENVTPLLEIKLKANKPNLLCFAKVLPKMPSFEGFPYQPGGRWGAVVFISPSSYTPAFIKYGQHRVGHYTPNMKSDPSRASGKLSRTEPLYLCKDVDQGQVKARTKIPLRRLNWVCVIWQTGNKGPEVLLYDTQTQSFYPGYLPKQMVRILPSIIKKNKSPLSTHRMLDFTQLPGAPSRENHGQMYPKWVSFSYWVLYQKSIKY